MNKAGFPGTGRAPEAASGQGRGLLALMGLQSPTLVVPPAQLSLCSYLISSSSIKGGVASTVGSHTPNQPPLWE